MILRIAILLLVFFMPGCEERYMTELQSEETGLLAVEGVLTNENISHKINLSFPYRTLNGDGTPASGAVVQVQEGTGTVYTFSEDPTTPGAYYSPPFRAVFGVTYTLQIGLNGRQYRAQDSSVPVGPMGALQVQPLDEQFELVLNETGDDPYYIDHQLSWKNTSACLPNEACEGRVVFYDLKSIDVNEIYKPAKKQFLFPAGTTVIRKKHSVSAAYRAYLRSVLSETEWRGGIFDVDRANPTSNLTSGATGFFAITTVVSDTTVVQ